MIRNLRCQEEARQLQGFLDTHRILDLEIRCPDIAEQFPVIAQWEQHQTLHGGHDAQSLVPVRVTLAECRPVVLILDDEAAAAADCGLPLLCNLKEVGTDDLPHRAELVVVDQILAQYLTDPAVEVRQHDDTLHRTADRADVADDLIHGFLEVLGAAQLDAGRKHIGGRLIGKIRHSRGIRLLGDDLRIGAVVHVGLIGFQREEVQIHPEIKPFGLDEGMQRTLLDSALVHICLEVQVLRNIVCIGCIRNEPPGFPAAALADEMRSLDRCHIRRIACYNSDIAVVVVRKHLDGHDAGHGDKMLRKRSQVLYFHD